MFYMRLFLIIFISIFSLNSGTKADNISDFQIEGISIGDSLLNFMSESEIISAKNNSTKMGKDYLVIYYYYLPSGSKLYDYVTVAIDKNDKKYIVEAINGNLIFDNDIEACKRKKDSIVKEIKSLFKNVNFSDRENVIHPIDPTQKTFFSSFDVNFDSGAWATVGCTDWSKKMTKEKGWKDHLDIGINSSKYTSFLRKHYD